MTCVIDPVAHQRLRSKGQGLWGDVCCICGPVRKLSRADKGIGEGQSRKTTACASGNP